MPFDEDRAAETAGTADADALRRAFTERSRIGADVLDLWTDVLAERRPLLPRQDDLPASALGPALAYAFVLERIGPGIARFRHAGQRVQALMGLELRGMPITAFSAPGGRSRLLALTDAVFDGPETVEIDLLARRAGRTSLLAEMLLLPLADETGTVRRALGTLVPKGPQAFVPCRFQVVHARRTPMARAGARADWRPTRVPYLHIVR